MLRKKCHTVPKVTKVMLNPNTSSLQYRETSPRILAKVELGRYLNTAPGIVSMPGPMSSQSKLKEK